jgi:hypothetical protein
MWVRRCRHRVGDGRRRYGPDLHALSFGKLEQRPGCLAVPVALKSFASVFSPNPITLWFVLTPVIIAVIVGALSGVIESDEYVRDRAVCGNWSSTSWPSTPTEKTGAAVTVDTPIPHTVSDEEDDAARPAATEPSLIVLVVDSPSSRRCHTCRNGQQTDRRNAFPTSSCHRPSFADSPRVTRSASRD